MLAMLLNESGYTTQDCTVPHDTGTDESSVEHSSTLLRYATERAGPAGIVTPPVHPTEIRTSISPSSSIELNTTSADKCKGEMSSHLKSLAHVHSIFRPLPIQPDLALLARRAAA
uniref:Uncharacterized protein n=1 Tax=Timema cristinae TaxID=61476 RepID=A0A7R9D5G6_TIMCR|nr:unnamed protein product [Timema cristinae]